MYSTREFATTSRAMPFASTAVSSSDTCIVSGRVLEESELDELRAEVEGMLARGGRGKSAAQMRAYTPPADSPDRCACSTTLHLFVGLSKLLFGCATQSRDEAQFCMEV